ncbi:MAG TPA: hypothetical protein VG370_31175 [Chloroflexota bacterium]|nr:hypothetical protein [Chloroflexota bacterium]
MTRTVRVFLLLEGVGFLLAALVHAGVLVGGYEDAGARTAESVIGGVLLVGLALTRLAPARTRMIGVAAQGFALAGTIVGTYLSLAGIGASTVPDRVYHVAILLALVWGLTVAARSAGEEVATA